MAKPAGVGVSSAANFDHVARVYRWAEYVSYGPLLERVRTSLLGEFGGCRHALVLGDGDGRFAAALLRCHREVKVLAVDTSAAMLHLLRHRCLKAVPQAKRRLRTQHTSALEIVPSRDTDLVISHFFLDCLTPPELEHIVQQFAKHLSPGARWLVSDFALPRPPVLRPLAKIYLRLLYAIFGLLTGLQVSRLPPISDTLHAAGFQRLVRREFAAGMLYSEVWQLPAQSKMHAHNQRPRKPIRN